MGPFKRMAFCSPCGNERQVILPGAGDGAEVLQHVHHVGAAVEIAADNGRAKQRLQFVPDLLVTAGLLANGAGRVLEPAQRLNSFSRCQQLALLLCF